MDLLDSLRALLRRWPLTVTLLLATIAATVGAAVVIPWQYESSATVVFLSSRKGSQPVGGNPWLAFDASLTITAEVISRGMSDERTLQTLKSQGNTAEYTVGLAQDSRGPLLDITATGPDPKIAQATMETLARLSQERLTEMQRKSAILPDATIRAELVTATDKAELTPEKKIRLLVIIFAGGMLLTIGVPLFLESLAQKRRQQAQAEHTVARTGQPPGAPRPPRPASAGPRPAAGGPPRPGGSAVPRARSSARLPRSETPAEPRPSRPAEPGAARPAGSGGARPAEPRGQDRRPPAGGLAKHRPPAEPRDPWDDKAVEEGYTAPMQAISAEDDLYVWSGDQDPPNGATSSGGPAARSARAGGLSSSPNGRSPRAAGGEGTADTDRTVETELPAGTDARGRTANGGRSSSGRGGRTGGDRRSARDADPDDEPYVVFDPTRPGR
ncbi:hypothetical protein Sru01_57400 [Sphaerisporangium rufum]|uniref:Capsular polysaccharide biosynthesis protein n=1 Tax=Sphaerisporangium rufum TaxID=1381558 RepID=A0A919V436_9ACTN|nr:hypothetical protein [Sphaerisporangium rufum]GII80758.1 hypothetical protein Sru01_57400 [Sphaerisporangium rufum]